jgi:hypothetical protein
MCLESGVVGKLVLGQAGREILLSRLAREGLIVIGRRSIALAI